VEVSLYGSDHRVHRIYKGKTPSLKRDKAVSILTRLGARRLQIFGSILRRDKRVRSIFSPNSRERLWERPKDVFNREKCLLPLETKRKRV
jgi:hypothetical protein